MSGNRSRAAIVAAAPLLLLLGFVSHPYLPGRQPNVDAIAAAVGADTTRWALSHLATSMGAILLIVAFLAVDRYVRDLGVRQWRGSGLGFIVVGTALYALLPAMEFAPLAAVETGGDVRGAQTALLPWFSTVIVVAALSSMFGTVRFARALTQARVMSRRLTGLVAGALLVMAVARFVPFAAVQFYVQGAAALVALWPLAYGMWMRPQQAGAADARPVVATSPG
jgi:hypothetical protein